MTFFTRPRLDDLQFRQIETDVLTLSGRTFFPLAQGLNLGSTGSTFYSFDLTTGGTIGDTLVLSPAGTIIWGSSAGVSSSGGAFITNTRTGGTNTGLIFQGVTSGQSYLRTLSGGTGINIVTSGDLITITSSGGTIGAARDGTYTDGLLAFTESTPIGYAIDDINEILGLLAPQQPSNLDNQSIDGNFVEGKLSFGDDNAITNYTNVTVLSDPNGFGGSPINENELFEIDFDDNGIVKDGNILGILNDDVSGNVSGIPFEPNAFKSGNQGELNLILNGNIIDTLSLTGTTASTASTYLNVSEQKFVKIDNGNPFGGLIYRTGDYTISTSDTNLRAGYNIVRVVHSAATFNRITNYKRFVFDTGSTAIVVSNEQFSEINLTGSKYISGVEYHTGGNVKYEADATGVYKNTFSSATDAISFPTRINLGTQTAISITGSGIINGSSQSLPNLDISQANPQDDDIHIVATLPINENIVLGNLAPKGELESNIRIRDCFSGHTAISTGVDELGFLIYNVTQLSDLQEENFTGEVNRLQARDYTSLLYANINGSSYKWIANQNLVSGNTQHNKGLLVFDGSLYYPNSSLLLSEYGISNGNFNGIVNSQSGNVNYTTASGIRNYYRKFKSVNAITQSTLTFEIAHDGDENSFLTNGGIGGTPTGNQIKLEFAIKRSGGATHGWANPFASSNNPEGIAKTSVSHSAGVTTISCTLSTTPRVAINDIVVVRLFVADTYSEKISRITITNID